MICDLKYVSFENKYHIILRSYILTNHQTNKVENYTLFSFTIKIIYMPYFEYCQLFLLFKYIIKITII
jgi:hypothetical protein